MSVVRLIVVLFAVFFKSALSPLLCFINYGVSFLFCFISIIIIINIIIFSLRCYIDKVEDSYVDRTYILSCIRIMSEISRD